VSQAPGESDPVNPFENLPPRPYSEAISPEHLKFLRENHPDQAPA